MRHNAAGKATDLQLADKMPRPGFSVSFTCSNMAANGSQIFGVPRALPVRSIRRGHPPCDGHPGAGSRQRLPPRRMLTILSLAAGRGPP